MTRVYAIEGGDTGLIKIGRAGNPASRLRDMQTGSPVPLRLLCSARETETVNEASLHRRFAPYRVHGEWFDIADEDVAAELLGFGMLEDCA